MPKGQFPAKTEKGRAKQAAQQVDWAEKRRRVCELKLVGLTFEQIARAMGFKNKSTPYRIWTKAMADIPRVAADKMRGQYDQRTDRALRTAFDIMAKTDVDPRVRLQAAQTVADIEADRAKILGFAAPSNVRLSGPTGGAIQVASATVDHKDLAGLSDEELGELRADLARTAQAIPAAAAAVVGGAGDGAPAPSTNDPG